MVRSNDKIILFAWTPESPLVMLQTWNSSGDAKLYRTPHECRYLRNTASAKLVLNSLENEGITPYSKKEEPSQYEMKSFMC